MHLVDLLFGMSERDRGAPRRSEADRPAPSVSVSLAPAASTGVAYPDDARFDLFVDGDRAGYALTPDEVKRQVAERLDIEMRRIGGHGPEPRRSLAETAAEIERLHGRSPTDDERANTIPAPGEGRDEDDATC